MSRTDTGYGSCQPFSIPGGGGISPQLTRNAKKRNPGERRWLRHGTRGEATDGRMPLAHGRSCSVLVPEVAWNQGKIRPKCSPCPSEGADRPPTRTCTRYTSSSWCFRTRVSHVAGGGPFHSRGIQLAFTKMDIRLASTTLRPKTASHWNLRMRNARASKHAFRYQHEKPARDVQPSWIGNDTTTSRV